jgi:isopenicillin N synthase-like dioxygenase
MITLLFQKDIGGLEVQDAEGAWHPVAPENDAIVINTGDLMEHWTNGRYRSTPHRVQPKLRDIDRYSIAVFVDPDTETPVKVLDSCLKPGEKPRYPAITAGEHIQERIRASHQ